jgi:hypothetical protein
MMIKDGQVQKQIYQDQLILVIDMIEDIEK